MNPAPSPRRIGPPHNPGVRNLVAAKRRWSSPPNPEQARQGFRGWNERGFLPHRDEPGLVQFVTFRFADCFPAALRPEWEHLLGIEHDRERRTQLEAYLDRGRGDCCLRRPEIAGLVETALRFFHGQRYELRAWVVMPNHVHALFKVDSVPMSRIVLPPDRRPTSPLFLLARCSTSAESPLQHVGAGRVRSQGALPAGGGRCGWSGRHSRAPTPA